MGLDGKGLHCNHTLMIGVPSHVFDNEKLLWWVENQDGKNNPNEYVNFMWSFTRHDDFYITRKATNKPPGTPVLRQINT